MYRRWLYLLALPVVAGCGLLEPAMPEADPGTPSDWPATPATPDAAAVPDSDTGSGGAIDAAGTGWREFFGDPELERLIEQALGNNRDLRAAVLNVDRARALYRIQRAERVPSLDATGTMTRGGGNSNLQFTETYSVDLGVSAWELDLFGRVRSLSEARLQAYLAREEAQRSATLSLVAEVANAWLTLSADRELQSIAEAALANREKSLELTRKRFELGAASSLEVTQSRIEVETARADVWVYAGRVAQAVNALAVLTGTPQDIEELDGPADLRISGLDPLPAGMPADVLLRRPDVMQAEHTLRAANASIGAARAAFFPSITLTGSIGTASDELSGLFESGSDAWSFIPRINVPIFQAGRLRGNLDVSRADRDIALAEYEGSIQDAFREVADALALTETLAAQRASREALLKAAERANELSQLRYDAGADSFLVHLDAQRTLYSARQSLVSTLLAEQANRVTLYKALGGGWQ